MNKELFLMRHAKSSWDARVPDDFSRPLNQRGIDAATRIGAGLHHLNWTPDLLIASPSVRTQQTLRLMQLDVPMDDDKRLYEASLHDLFYIINNVPESINKLMILGHNPSLEQLLLRLVPSAERQKNGKLLTTANVARISISVQWKNIQKNQGDLLGLIRPKELI